MKKRYLEAELKRTIKGIERRLECAHIDDEHYCHAAEYLLTNSTKQHLICSACKSWIQKEEEV